MIRRSVILAVLLLAGCVAAPPAVPPEEAAQPLIAPDRLLTLPRPADLGRKVQAVQLVTFRRQDKVLVLEGHLSITPERLLLVGIDSLGRRAMTLTWTPAGLTADVAPWLPPGLRPGSLLADLVLLYWPADVVRTSLPAGAVLTEHGRTRQVMLDGKPLLRAEYGFDPGGRWIGRLHYANFAWGYEIDVQSEETGS